jgi:hypothetical protein
LTGTRSARVCPWVHLLVICQKARLELVGPTTIRRSSRRAGRSPAPQPLVRQKPMVTYLCPRRVQRPGFFVMRRVNRNGWPPSLGNHRPTSSEYALLLPLRSFASRYSHVWTCIPRRSIRPLHLAEGSCVPRTSSYLQRAPRAAANLISRVRQAPARSRRHRKRSDRYQ